MITETAAKRDTQKLQRAIVDGLEDVKAQDIQVFDTEHLSALFERVIVASGTSNRQTKALAASVRDAVREAGFPKPRIEGEANGEWIIVDCAQAVVHIMQPGIRTYYHLEELWGEKPVRLKFGTAKPAIKTPLKVAPAKPATGRKGSVKAVPAKSGSAKAASARVVPVKSAPNKAAPNKAAPTKAVPTKAVPTKAVAKPVRKAPAYAPAKSASAQSGTPAATPKSNSRARKSPEPKT